MNFRDKNVIGRLRTRSLFATTQEFWKEGFLCRIVHILLLAAALGKIGPIGKDGVPLQRVF
jgi:hypothetical protein